MEVVSSFCFFSLFLWILHFYNDDNKKFKVTLLPPFKRATIFCAKDLQDRVSDSTCICPCTFLSMKENFTLEQQQQQQYCFIIICGVALFVLFLWFCLPVHQYKNSCLFFVFVGCQCFMCLKLYPLLLSNNRWFNKKIDLNPQENSSTDRLTKSHFKHLSLTHITQPNCQTFSCSLPTSTQSWRKFFHYASHWTKVHYQKIRTCSRSKIKCSTRKKRK